MDDSHIIYQRDILALKILSFDIEVLPGDKIPRDGKNKVLQIGNTIGYHGKEGIFVSNLN